MLRLGINYIYILFSGCYNLEDYISIDDTFENSLAFERQDIPDVTYNVSYNIFYKVKETSYILRTFETRAGYKYRKYKEKKKSSFQELSFISISFFDIKNSFK